MSAPSLSPNSPCTFEPQLEATTDAFTELDVKIVSIEPNPQPQNAPDAPYSAANFLHPTDPQNPELARVSSCLRPMKLKPVSLSDMAPTYTSSLEFEKAAQRWSESDRWVDLDKALEQEELSKRGLLVGLERKLEGAEDEKDQEKKKRALDFRFLEVRVYETWVDGSERDVIVKTFY